MKKRALAALLALILCISCFTPAGNAAAAVKQQDVEVQLINLMKQYCGTYWAQNYYGARQCKGFADMISDKLFGLTGGPGPYSDSHYYLPYAESRGYQKIGILAPGSCTAENLRALFLKARPGDYVQCVRCTGTQHSLIVADVHTTGVTFFDCNLKASDLCACYFYDWTELGKNITRGCSLYRYSGYVASSTPSLIFNANGGTCATTSKAVAAGSAFGTLPTPERKGYKFDYWYIISCNSSREPDRYQVNANTVKTSLCDTVLFAHWTKDTGPCANGHSWSAPQTIAPTCTDNGYTLETCNVCDATRITKIVPALGHNYALVSSQPATNVEDGAELYLCSRCGTYYTKVILCQLHKFTDLNVGAWYYSSVRQMVSHALMNGTSQTAFSPDKTLTRAMLVTILWRMEGEPQVMPSGFRDVAAGKWYTGAVDWASDDGVIRGYPDATFHPDDAVTREQAAVILFRFAPVIGRSNAERADLSKYADAYKISPFAREAMSWANACGILNGYKDGSLRPGGTASRAEIAKMIVTFLNQSTRAVQ